MLDGWNESPFLLGRKNPKGEYADFLCGRRCRNKRERERIENEAREQQLAYEREMEALILKEQQAMQIQQAGLDDYQKGLQELQLQREMEIAADGGSAYRESGGESRAGAWVLALVLLSGAGIFAYFKLRK